MKRFLLISARLILSLVFIASALLKLTDPQGLEWRLHEILYAMNMSLLNKIILYPFILFAVFELVIGIFLLLKASIKKTSLAALIASFVVFAANISLHIANYSLYSADTQFQIIRFDLYQFSLITAGILLFGIFLFMKRKFYSSIWSRQGSTVLGVFVVVIGLSYTIVKSNSLPDFYFSRWETAANIPALVLPVEEVSEPCFVYLNIENQTYDSILINDFTNSGVWNDSIWLNAHRFVDRADKVIKPFREAIIPGFVVKNAFGDDIGKEIFLNPKPYFVVVSHNLKKASLPGFHKIAEFAKEAEMWGYETIGITSTDCLHIDYFRHENNLAFDIYQVENHLLTREIVRANPGIILIANRMLVNKWHYKKLPDFTSVRNAYLAELQTTEKEEETKPTPENE